MAGSSRAQKAAAKFSAVVMTPSKKGTSVSSRRWSQGSMTCSWTTCPIAAKFTAMPVPGSTLPDTATSSS